MRLGIDIDEVVTKFMIKFLEFHEKQNNEKIEFKDLIDYKLWEVTNLSKKQSYQAIYDFYDSSLFDNLELIEGVVDSIKELSNKYEIVFITSRPDFIRNKTESFLNKYFSDIKFTTIYSGEWNHKNNGGKSKGELCLDQEVDFMVEDYYVYASDCANRGVKTFLLEKPWNTKSEDHENIIKVKHWNEILEMLK